MADHDVSYSERILRSGKGVVAWQRLARFKRAAAEILAHSDAAKLDVLVDVGAADGIGLPFWRPVAACVISLNRYHNHSIEFARCHAGETVVTCDARHLPLGEGFADAVVSLETLHLLSDRRSRIAALEDIRRVLKPTGTLVCSVPIEVGLPAVVKYFGRRRSGFDLEGMTFGMMLRHCFWPLFNVSRCDRGTQVGFNAYRFAADAGKVFRIARRIRIPLPYPLSTNLMLVCKPRT